MFLQSAKSQAVARKWRVESVHLMISETFSDVLYIFYMWNIFTDIWNYCFENVETH